MTDVKKTPESADQDPPKKTATEREVDRIADEAAEKAGKTERRFDEEHGIFTE